MINKDNYQAYFLDYIEGNLSPKEVEMLLSFLNENPELKIELSNYEEVTVFPQQINFPKESIYQVDFSTNSITRDNFEKFAIAYIEGELPENRIEEFNYFIHESESLDRDFSLLEQAKLKPNLSITYPNKSKLKRKASVLPLFYRVSTAAAILLFFYFSFFNSNTIIEEQPNHSFSFESNREKEISARETNVSISAIANSNNTNVSASSNSPINKAKAISASLMEVEPISSKQVLLAEKQNDYVLSKVKKSMNVNTSPIEDDFNQTDNFLSPKEFLATIIKKNVLKVADDSPELSFSDVLVGVSNEKISFPTKGSQRMIAISTKNFSFEKKISN